jgi:hypothetical protein
MIVEDVLVIWSCLAAISAATDAVFMYRTLSGRDGADALALTREHAARVGGVSNWVMRSLVLDLAMPWLIWQGLLTPHDD